MGNRPLTVILLIIWVLLYLIILTLFFKTHLKANKSKKEIRKLIALRDITTLKSMMPDRKPPLINATYENILVFFALLTLVDMETIRTFTNLQTNYHIWSKFTNVLPFTREVLAIKLNHLSVEDFMSDFTEQIDEEQPYESNEQKTLLEMYADEFAIQISKAYIIPTLPQKAKCMISKIELNPSSDLLVCPYCVSFAKADLLANWLEIKKNCPICNRLLRIEDCPIVIIRSS